MDKNQLLPLTECTISVIGVSIPDEEKRIIRIIKELGGTFSPIVIDSLFCVLTKKLGYQNNAIKEFEIPTIDLQWLWDCRAYRRKLPFDQYYAKPFIGLTISCTGYTNEERNLIENCVIENGGMFSSKMSRETCTHLITEEEDSSPTSKFAYARLWRTVQIVTMRWLTDCKKYESWINEYDYLVSTAAADAQVIAKRLEDEKKAKIAQANITEPVVIKMRFKDLATDEKSSMENLESFTNKIIGKKRQFNEMAPMQTLADFPSIELLDHKECRGLLNNETFFIAGFTPEVRDYLVCLILFAGGKRHHALTIHVTKILLGAHVDDKLLSAVRLHPLGATCVSISWVLSAVFSTVGSISDPDTDPTT